MPWPETTIPKFGEWDGNEDLSYSIVFDKARADKEKFLPALKNDSKDSSPNQKREKTPGSVAGNGAPQTSIDRIIETGRRMSENSSPKSSSKHRHQSFNDQRTFYYNQGNNSDTSDRSMPSTGQQPLQMVPRKDSVAQEMAIRANGSRFHAHHDGLHGRVERVPGPMRQMHQYPAITKISRSQGCSETSSIADLPEKVIVPKFGDWDADDGRAGDGFTVIFDRVRDEKKSKVANKPPARFVSPLRPAEDLYKGSKAGKKKGGWLSTLCCVDIKE